MIKLCLFDISFKRIIQLCTTIIKRKKLFNQNRNKISLIKVNEKIHNNKHYVTEIPISIHAFTICTPYTA